MGSKRIMKRSKRTGKRSVRMTRKYKTRKSIMRKSRKTNRKTKRSTRSKCTKRAPHRHSKRCGSKKMTMRRKYRGGMMEYPFDNMGGDFNVPARVSGTVMEGVGSNLVGNINDMLMTQAKVGGGRRRLMRGGGCDSCGGAPMQLGGDGYSNNLENAIGNRAEILRYDWNYQNAPNRFDASIVPSLTGGARRRQKGGSQASDAVMAFMRR